MSLKPVGEVLRGLEVHDLDDGWTALDVVALVKCLDEEGDSRWLVRSSNGVNDTEAIGALLAQLDVLRHAYVSGWEEDDT